MEFEAVLTSKVEVYLTISEVSKVPLLLLGDYFSSVMWFHYTKVVDDDVVLTILPFAFVVVAAAAAAIFAEKLEMVALQERMSPESEVADVVVENYLAFASLLEPFDDDD